MLPSLLPHANIPGTRGEKFNPKPSYVNKNWLTILASPITNGLGLWFNFCNVSKFCYKFKICNWAESFIIAIKF